MEDRRADQGVDVVAEAVGPRGGWSPHRLCRGLCVATTYYYVSFSRLIDQRLHGERDRVLPRVFARPLEIRRGQSMSNRQLIDRLNELGYAQRAAVEKPGEFTDTASGSCRSCRAAPEVHGPGRPRRIRAASRHRQESQREESAPSAARVGPRRAARARHARDRSPHARRTGPLLDQSPASARSGGRWR